MQRQKLSFFKLGQMSKRDKKCKKADSEVKIKCQVLLKSPTL
jgi:hypothetical protein